MEDVHPKLYPVPWSPAPPPPPPPPPQHRHTHTKLNYDQDFKVSLNFLLD